MKTDSLDLYCTVTANPKHLECELDDQAVLLDLATKKYFGLNEVGLRIWQLSKNTISIEAIVEKIRQEFEVEDASCQSDCLAFIKELSDKGFVTVAKGDCFDGDCSDREVAK